MAQKTRNQLTQLTNSNIYDNGNKEILAQMLRLVVQDHRDSNFNLLDDLLKNFRYNATQSLEQYIDSVLGRVPIYGTVSGIDVGASTQTLAVDGIVIISASIIQNDGADTLYKIDFSESIANRRLVPVLQFNDNNWNIHNDVVTPVIRRISSQTINVAMREVSNNAQDLTLEIIAI